MTDLIQHTDLLELWEIFEEVSSVSMPSTQGEVSFVSLSCMDAYLRSSPKLPNVTHKEFWGAMSYFLFRFNQDILKKYKLRKKK